MAIDWITTLAQAINFLILVALLNRFLFRPVLAAVDEREASIRERLEEAERRLAQAEQERRALEQERSSFEGRRHVAFQELEDEIAERRRDLLERTRDEVDAVRDRWRGAVDKEIHALGDDLRERLASLVARASGRIIEDLADARLEGLMVARFAARLEDLDPRATAPGSGGAVTVQSSFELEEEDRDRLRKAIEGRYGAGVEVVFVRAPDLSTGIELRAGGEKVAWHVRDYLDDLEEHLSTLEPNPVEDAS